MDIAEKKQLLFEEEIPFPTPEEKLFTFIDLFAGIGGFRLALQNLGGECLFSSEWNIPAARTYAANFGDYPYGDITKEEVKLAIPKYFDVLCAGFPCQPFSISGRMKGFEDTRGTLIYEVFDVIRIHQPKVVFLENVKHLQHHNSGQTLEVILRSLEELGYYVRWEVLNASNFGVPQNRERIIIIASKGKAFDFAPLLSVKDSPILKAFLDKDEGQFSFLDEPYTLIDSPIRQKSGLIFCGYRNKSIRKVGVREGSEHLSRVHKQPNRIYSSMGVHPALPSQETSGRFFIYDEGAVRRLTIAECFRIMGFPDEYKRISILSDQYRQIGNSVCVPMIQAIGNEIIQQILLPLCPKELLF